MKKFSIIIALAPDRTAPVLESLAKLDYPKKDYEIIIEKGLNPSENRNRGIKKAEGEILYFLDDDAVVELDILAKAEKFFQDYDADVAGGPQLTPEDDKFFAKASGYAMSSFFATHKMSNRYKKGRLNLNADEYHLASVNLFIKRDVFNSTPGFNAKLYPGEDSELLKRLKSLKFKIAYCPELYVYHKRRPTFSSFFKQFFNYGRVAVQKEKTSSMKPTLIHILPALCILYTITYLILMLILDMKTTFYLSFPFMLYTIVVLLNSLYLAVRNNILTLLLLPFIFLSIHTSYGLGMIYGLIKRIFNSF